MTEMAPRRASGFVTQHDTDTRLIAASAMIGEDVTNMADEDLGEIEDLMIGRESGHIVYAVVSVGGGILGLQTRLCPVPWEALVHDRAEKKFRFRSAINKDRLQMAPTLDHDRAKWPDTFDRDWLTDLNDFYGVIRTY